MRRGGNVSIEETIHFFLITLILIGWIWWWYAHYINFE